MKKGILYLLFLLSFGVLQAQTGFEAKSLVVDTTFDANTFDPVGKGKVCNTGTDTICLLWRIEEDMVPLGWTPYFCDNNLCYGPGTDMCPDDNPVCLGPDECGVMDLHLLPGANPVCGKYNVVVWEQGDTSNYLVISYQFNCAPSSTHDAAYEDVKVFPNPTASYFEVSDELNLSGITVHNLLGKVVRSFNVHEGGRYDVSGLSNGMYVVNLIGDNNRAVKSVRLRKE